MYRIIPLLLLATLQSTQDHPYFKFASTTNNILNIQTTVGGLPISITLCNDKSIIIIYSGGAIKKISPTGQELAEAINITFGGLYQAYVDDSSIIIPFTNRFSFPPKGTLKKYSLNLEPDISFNQAFTPSETETYFHTVQKHENYYYVGGKIYDRNTSTYYPLIARFNLNGSLDLEFSNNGYLIFDSLENNFIIHLVFLQDVLVVQPGLLSLRSH